MSRPASMRVESADCECHNSYLPTGFDGSTPQGPPIFMPTPTAVPITTMPSAQAPATFKLPQAAATPYVPTH